MKLNERFTAATQQEATQKQREEDAQVHLTITALDEKISRGKHLLSVLEGKDEEAKKLVENRMGTRGQTLQAKNKAMEELANGLEQDSEFARFLKEKGVTVDELLRVNALSAEEREREMIPTRISETAEAEDISHIQELKTDRAKTRKEVASSLKERVAIKRSVRAFIPKNEKGESELETTTTPLEENGKEENLPPYPAYTSLALELQEYLRRLEDERAELSAKTPEGRKNLEDKKQQRREEQKMAAILMVKERHNMEILHGVNYTQWTASNYVNGLPLKITAKDLDTARQYGKDLVTGELQKEIETQARIVIERQIQNMQDQRPGGLTEDDRKVKEARAIEEQVDRIKKQIASKINLAWAEGESKHFYDEHEHLILGKENTEKQREVFEEGGRRFRIDQILSKARTDLAEALDWTAQMRVGNNKDFHSVYYSEGIAKMPQFEESFERLEKEKTAHAENVIKAREKRNEYETRLNSFFSFGAAKLLAEAERMENACKVEKNKITTSEKELIATAVKYRDNLSKIFKNVLVTFLSVVTTHTDNYSHKATAQKLMALFYEKPSTTPREVLDALEAFFKPSKEEVDASEAYEQMKKNVETIKQQHANTYRD